MNSCWRWWKCPMKFNGSGLSQPPADGQDGRPHREIVQVQPLRLTWGKRLKTHGETHRETMGFNPSENHREIWRFNHSYSLVICYIAIENTPFSSLIYLFKMVIFYSYVSLPEGTLLIILITGNQRWQCNIHEQNDELSFAGTIIVHESMVEKIQHATFDYQR